jgi:hypothetical protein
MTQGTVAVLQDCRINESRKSVLARGRSPTHVCLTASLSQSVFDKDKDNTFEELDHGR